MSSDSKNSANSGKGQSLAIIVEDNPVVSGVVAAMLSQFGLEPIEFTSSDRLADFFAKQGSDCCVLVLDHQLLTGVDGLTSLSELRDRGVDAPAVVMSGTEMTADWGALRAAFLLKPFRRQELADALTRLGVSISDVGGGGSESDRSI